MNNYKKLITLFIFFIFSLSNSILIATVDSMDLDNKIKFQLEKQMTMIKQNKNAINTNEEQLNNHKKLISQIDILAKINEKSISNYFLIISLFSGIVIALVAIVLGLGAYKFYMDEKQIVDRTHKLLDKQEEQISKWFEKKKSDFQIQVNDLYKNFDKDIQNLKYFNYLKTIIDHPENEILAEEVFPLLTPLTEDPKILYKPLFEKIHKLDIHPDVTNKVKRGLEKLKKL